MGRERDVDGREVGADLVAEEGTAERRACAPFFENEAVVDGCDGDVGGADVDDEAGGFAGCEAGADAGFGEVECRDVKVLEDHFDGAFAVFGGVPGGLGHEEGVFGELGREARGDGRAPEEGGGVPVGHCEELAIRLRSIV